MQALRTPASNGGYPASRAMKLQNASDPHLEYALDGALRVRDAAVLVLTGDIGTHTPLAWTPSTPQIWAGGGSTVSWLILPDAPKK